MRPRTSRSALPRQTSTRPRPARALATATSTTSGTGCISAVAARAAPPERGQAAAGPAAPALGLVALGHEQQVDPPGAERRERGRQAGHRPPARRRAPPGGERRGPPRRGAGCPARPRSPRPGSGRPRPRPSARPGRPAARAGTGAGRARGRSEPRADPPITRRSKAPRWKTSKASAADRRRCCCACSESWLPTRVFDELAAVVLAAAHQLVGVLAVVDQLAQLEHVHAGPLAIDEQHADPFVLLEHRFELADARHGLDDELAGDPHRQLEDLPQATGGAREHRQPTRGAPGQAADVLGHALEVLLHRRRATVAGRGRCCRPARRDARAWRTPSRRRRAPGAVGRRRPGSSW